MDRSTRRTGVIFLFLASLAMAACTEPTAETNDDPEPRGDIRLVTVADGLEHAWGIAFLPGDEGILVTERPGRLRIIRNGELEAEPISGVPQVSTQGQGGLLDVALHPDFQSNRLVYLSYSKPGDEGATTAVARGRLGEGELTDLEDVFVAEAWGSDGRHFGSRLVFDGAGHLYVTVGDRGEMERAQDLGDHAGTTLRLMDDGSVPPDNPFVGTEDALDEIFTYGNRNSQGMAIHPETGEVWQSEHGPRGGDVINRMVAGANYGWPEYNYGDHYDGESIPDPHPEAGIEMPLIDWTPAIAPGGITFYTGDVFPDWYGNLFVASLVEEHVRRLRFEGTTPVEDEPLLRGNLDRVRSIATSPDGFLYLLIDEPSAPVLRIEPEDDEEQGSPTGDG